MCLAVCVDSQTTTVSHRQTLSSTQTNQCTGVLNVQEHQEISGTSCQGELIYISNQAKSYFKVVRAVIIHHNDVIKNEDNSFYKTNSSSVSELTFHKSCVLSDFR